MNRSLGYCGLAILTVFVLILAKMTLDADFPSVSGSWTWIAAIAVALIFSVATWKVMRWAGMYRLEGRRRDSFPYQSSGIVPPSQNPPPPPQHD